MYERIRERKRGRGKADYLRKPFELVIVPGESELAQQNPAIYKTKIT